MAIIDINPSPFAFQNPRHGQATSERVIPGQYSLAPAARPIHHGTSSTDRISVSAEARAMLRALESQKNYPQDTARSFNDSSPPKVLHKSTPENISRSNRQAIATYQSVVNNSL